MNLIWFRNDLRTADHAALTAAMEDGPCIGVFVICAEQWRQHDVGAHRVGFLLRCLASLSTDLEQLNVPLHIADAGTFAQVPQTLAGIAQQYDAQHIYCTEEQPLNERIRDSKVARALADDGRQLHSFDGGCILPPGAVLKGDGDPYTVFTPFKKRWLTRLDGSARSPLPIPTAQPKLSIKVARGQRNLPSKIRGDHTKALTDLLAELWPGGSAIANARLISFSGKRLADYGDERDIPDLPGTSQLSPYLAVGAISARQCLAAALAQNNGRAVAGSPKHSNGAEIWISELVWRDFYRHIVTLFPQVCQHLPFRADTDKIPWRHNEQDLAAWQAGQTGYPLVDAAMRQLNQTGWMHNRLRMVSAMFLSKHLLLDWRLGERYFMQQLVDGDFAANNGGWQWSASTGTDAVPYFRIFNPATQAERFDAKGDFVCRYVPELSDFRDAALAKQKKQFFNPWQAKGQLAQLLGSSGYPQPIVEHKAARERALLAFKGNA